MFTADFATIIEAASAALVGIVALGTIVGVVTRAVNKRQSVHITALVTLAITTMLEPIKEALGEKNGNGDAMEMLARTLGQTAELLAGQDDITDLETRLLALHTYTHEGVHELRNLLTPLKGHVDLLWADYATAHDIEEDKP